MSYKLLYRLRSVGNLPGPEKGLLRFLCEISENHETAWQSMEQFAFHTGYSERTVQRALRSLEHRGILILVEKGKGRGSRLIYRINLDAAAPVAQPSVEIAPVVTEPPPPTNGTKPEPPTPEQLAEQYAQHKAKLEAMKAEIAAKKREDKRERPGRAARNHTKLV